VLAALREEIHVPKGENFAKRLARLQSELDACDTPLLQNLHRVAIDQTHAAAKVFLELEDAASDDMARYNKWANKDSEGTSADTRALADQSEALVRNLKANPRLVDEPRFQVDESSLRLRAWSLEAHIYNFELSELYRTKEIEGQKRSITVLFDQILSPERGKFSIEAVKSAFGFAVGMVPVAGTLADALTRIRDLAKRHPIRAGEADAHVQYLSDYYAALCLWIEDAQALIQRLRTSPYP
jgi:hypothetical protein